MEAIEKDYMVFGLSSGALPCYPAEAYLLARLTILAIGGYFYLVKVPDYHIAVPQKIFFLFLCTLHFSCLVCVALIIPITLMVSVFTSLLDLPMPLVDLSYTSYLYFPL